MERAMFTRLVEWKHTPRRKPLRLKGARQVGKTYILNQFGDDRCVALNRGLGVDDSIPETAHGRLWRQLKIFFITGGLSEIVQLYVDLKDSPFDAL